MYNLLKYRFYTVVMIVCIILLTGFGVLCGYEAVIKGMNKDWSRSTTATTGVLVCGAVSIVLGVYVRHRLQKCYWPNRFTKPADVVGIGGI